MIVNREAQSESVFGWASELNRKLELRMLAVGIAAGNALSAAVFRDHYVRLSDDETVNALVRQSGLHPGPSSLIAGLVVVGGEMLSAESVTQPRKWSSKLIGSAAVASAAVANIGNELYERAVGHDMFGHYSQSNLAASIQDVAVGTGFSAGVIALAYGAAALGRNFAPTGLEE